MFAGTNFSITTSKQKYAGLLYICTVIREIVLKVRKIFGQKNFVVCDN